MKFSRILIIRSDSASRAEKFAKYYSNEIWKYAHEYELKIKEIFLEKVPFEDTTEVISGEFNRGDLILAVGGDGTARVAIDAVMASSEDIRENVAIAFLPLGNGNDFSRAINHKNKVFREIISQKITEFSPLEFEINRGEKRIFTPSYATLGITTAAVDLLNQDFIREKRRKFAKFSPVAALSFRDLPGLSRKINQLEVEDFSRDGRNYRDDSVGFFLVGAAHGLLPLRKFTKTDLFENQKFFFHSADIRGKFGGKTLFGKGLRAGGWTTFGLPGVKSTEEKLEFSHVSDLVLNTGGDNIVLEKVREIRVWRSEKTVKIFANRSRNN